MMTMMMMMTEERKDRLVLMLLEMSWAARTGPQGLEVQ